MFDFEFFLENPYEAIKLSMDNDENDSVSKVLGTFLLFNYLKGLIIESSEIIPETDIKIIKNAIDTLEEYVNLLEALSNNELEDIDSKLPTSELQASEFAIQLIVKHINELTMEQKLLATRTLANELAPTGELTKLLLARFDNAVAEITSFVEVIKNKF